MDVVKSASILRDQMVVLDVAQKQTELLDEQIRFLSGQSLMSSLDGNTTQSLQLSLRLSVSQGVKQMYQQVADTKWSQVQTIARSILSQLQDTGSSVPVTSPSPGVSTSTDTSVSVWSRSYCEFYRDN